MSKIYFVATRHGEYPEQRFPEGSTVIDPWRYIPDQRGVEVRRLGENKPAMISLLVPTRQRPEQFKRMALSARSLASYPRSMEVVAYVDEDDDSPYMEAPWITYIRGPRILLSDTWNVCFKQARGELFMHCGDDIVFQTAAWDAVVRNAFARFPDKIVLVHGDDVSPNTDALATHGFLHRKWVETVGYFVPPLFSSDWNDVWLTDVADMIGRRVKVPIVTEHMHYSFGKAERDQNTAEREERGIRDNVVDLYKTTVDQRRRDADKLKKALAA